MDLDEQMTEEMQRLQTEAALELYVPVYKIDQDKIKIALNNVISLHNHFKDIEYEPNVLAADVIGFAESRKRNENMHFALKRFRLIRLDETEKESVNRPHHGLALYVKEYFHVQKVVKLHCQSCEFILPVMHNIQKGYVEVVILYKYPKKFTDCF